MTATYRLKSIAVCGAVLLLVPLGLSLDLEAAERPNILFIIVDDQSPFDLKSYSPDSLLQTPNIDRLAREGMVFDGAHQMGAWVGAVCTASRHMIMSGRTVWHTPNKRGRRSNPNIDNAALVPPDLANYTLPAVFNRAGYKTMRTCKRGNSYEAANRLFAVRSASCISRCTASFCRALIISLVSLIRCMTRA